MRNSFLLTCALAGASVVHAQSMPGMPGMGESEHAHHHHDAEQLGHVNFPTSCSAKAQPEIERGVALLHSFGYTEAKTQFSEVVQSEPACAMGYWGVAMTQFTELWGRPERAAMKQGQDAMATARRLAAQKRVSAREQGYINAMSAFYAEGDVPFQKRADAYAARMDALHAAFPDDVEAAAFDALAKLASEEPADTSLTHERAALQLLVPLFREHPDHPGLAHYIIHTCDTPALAPEGLAAAREYAKIAPSSAHALHMPGHIFARLGMWQEDIASNEASVRASTRAEAEGQPGAAHQLHADEFLIYAYLQTGQDEKARALTASMQGVGERMAAMKGMDDMKGMGKYAANELNAVYLMEMQDWKGLAALQPLAGSTPEEAGFVYWGRGVAAGHLRDRKLADAALKDGEAAQAALVKKYPQYAAIPSVKLGEVRAWKAFADGKGSEAERLMRQAADQQDKLGQGEVDIPAREMLGDVLLLEGKPEAALVEYRVALKLSPNRLNGLLSAGAAAERAGDSVVAREFYRAAAVQTDGGKMSRRPQLGHAVSVAGTELAAR